MSKHTPGPWKIVDAWNDHMVEGQNGEEIIWQDGPHGTPTINEANARLIAAAPDLLEALENLADYVDERAGDNECRPIENARAAIAKAKGEE
jgi:gentisate 1,2-dioxygenase